MRAVAEFIDPVFAKTNPKRSFSMTENDSFGLVFAKTGHINSGTGTQENSKEKKGVVVGGRTQHGALCGLNTRQTSCCANFCRLMATPEMEREGKKERKKDRKRERGKERK